jgi:hypothetical protein
MEEFLRNNQDIIVALIAVLGISITAAMALKNNNKNILIKTVTDERAKWREELRKICAEFVRHIYNKANNSRITDTSRIIELKTHIQLRLNPSEDTKHKLDQDIIETLNFIVNNLDQPSGNVDVLKKLDDFQLYVQELLKAEWDKSKKEAETGKLEKQSSIVVKSVSVESDDVIPIVSMSKEKRDDVKLVFDFLRNIAICIGLVFGLPYLGDLIVVVFGSLIFAFLCIISLLTITLGLYLLNIMWLVSGLSERPTSKILHRISLAVIVSTSSVAIGGATFSEVLPIFLHYANYFF